MLIEDINKSKNTRERGELLLWQKVKVQQQQ